jgi:hypothetical protein
MGKRSCTSNPAVIEKAVALRSLERRSRQVASKTAAMSLLALRTELPSVYSEEAFPLNKPRFPLQPHRQGKAVKYSASSITDDEDETEEKMIVASKKRPDMFRVGHSSLTKLALRKPILSIAGTRRRETPTHRKLPFGRPIPPAPMLPSLLLSCRVILSTKKS